ncbi:helix-hairpin-helix domain-containing protein [Kytococcus sedentarius]|uniref:helix-hairpin-helix domain-containing protein n=1 Tax=Kytococcus sedentarius TaxID=1276 RepID=UPI0035BC4E9A
MEHEPEERVVWEPEGQRVDPASREPVSRVPRAVASVVEVPEAVAGARWGVESSVLRWLALAALLVVLGLGGWTWWTGRQAAPHPVAPGAVAPAPAPGHPSGAAGAAGPGDEGSQGPAGEGSQGPAGDGPGPEPAPAETVVSGEATGQGAEPGPVPGAPGDATPGPATVHVVGEVLRPGVVRVPAGSRVGDAVEKAGGLTGQADEQRLNLARPVSDGEQILVLRPGQEAPPPAPVQGGAGEASGDPGAGGAAGGGTAGEPAPSDGSSAPLDLNTADQAALEELPGVGPVTAGHILTWRTENGRFTTVDELMEVSGIGEKTLATLRPHVRVE